MKVKVKTFNGELLDLNPDKVYEVIKVFAISDNLVGILDDVGDYLVLRLSGCVHLNGGSWEIIND